MLLHQGSGARIRQSVVLSRFRPGPLIGTERLALNEALVDLGAGSCRWMEQRR